MSFSGVTKAELCRIRIQRPCFARAEALGILLYCNQFHPKIIKITTESKEFGKRLPLLFRKAFDVTFDQLPDTDSGQAKQTFILQTPQKLTLIWDVFGYDPDSIAHHINFAFLEDEPSRIAFLRGAFLSGGSVSDPHKSYHLELVTSHYYVSREMMALMLDMGLSPKETTRKSNYVTYFKQSGHIEDFLTTIGAPVAAMAVMNAKAEKNLRSGINRRVNCDAANADKTVDAAQEQLAAIRSLTESGRLLDLSEKHREAAQLREEYPELPLSELATLCQPPVTKSCLNHRLRKLVSLSKEPHT